MARADRRVAAYLETSPDPPVLVITVTETAAIVAGIDTVYRYDLPAAGIAEGWALPPLIDQIREVAGIAWPDVEVAIEADDDLVETIARTLINRGVPAYPAHLPDPGLCTPDEEQAPAQKSIEAEEAYTEGPSPGEEQPSRRGGRHRLEHPAPPAIKRPTNGRRHRAWSINPVYVTAGVIMVGVVGLSFWTLDQGADASQPDNSATPAVASSTLKTSPTPVETQRHSSTLPSPPTTPSPSVFEYAGLRVELPTGFQVRGCDEFVCADNPAEDVRLRFQVIDAAEAEVESVFYEDVARSIEADSSLEAVDFPSAQTPGDTTNKVRYKEFPGDGSEVLWSIWSDDIHRFTVGCHSRHQARLSHTKWCLRAIQTLHRY